EPTSAARITRGTRICHRIASSVGDSGEVTPGTWSLAPVDSSTSPIPRWTGPANTPTTSDTTRKATAEHAQTGVSPRARASETCSAAATTELLTQARERRRHGAEEVHEPRPPARRDRVVDAHDRARPHGVDAVPPRPGGHGRRLLPAADRVREHDQVGAR